ncbi:unnamed protein product [Owenia fusiformis]|uniref:Uncharacterized protein n=1 Tax=Owenia fusiformis TaxID=6347 RepID=A0A8J1U3P9_OWEFU|nr:unnamed protein product [Owenia fusiformis]
MTGRSYPNDLIAVTSDAVSRLLHSDSTSSRNNDTKKMEIYGEKNDAENNNMELLKSESLSESQNASYNTSTSSSASDVLIRTTEVRPASNPTSYTNRSSSLNSSGFSDNSKRVRVKTKKLREIKSPFEDTPLQSNASDTNIPPPLFKTNTTQSQTDTDNDNKVTGSYTNYRLGYSRSSSDQPKLPKEHSNIISENFSNMNPKIINKTKEEMKKVQPSSGSANYDSEPRREGNATGVDLSTSKAINSTQMKSKQATSFPEKDYDQATSSSVNPMVARRVIDARKYDDRKRSDQPEIVDVHPDEIVTIHGVSPPPSQDTSQTSQSSLSSDTIIKDRFSKFAKGTLQQGRPREIKDSLSLEPTKESDVQIQQYKLSDKQKLLKQSLTGRQGNAPVRRVVQPKLIGQNSSDTKEAQAIPASTSSSTAVHESVTAAVAATAAVAVTQPFIKAQQDLETRMALILEKLSTVNNPMSQSEDNTSSKQQQLEHQLSQITERRLEYLEKMQQQNFEIQAKILGLNQTESTGTSTKNGPGPSKDLPDNMRQYAEPSNVAMHSHSAPEMAPESSGLGPSPTQRFTPKAKSVAFYKHKVDEPEKPYVKFTKAQPVTDNHGTQTSILDTPAPRRQPPQPTAYTQHASSQARRPSKAKGILEEILSEAGKTPDIYSTPASKPRVYNDSPERHRSMYSTPTVKKYNTGYQDIRMQNKSESLQNGVVVDKARHLVEDLSELKNQMKDMIEKRETQILTNVTASGVSTGYRPAYTDASVLKPDPQETPIIPNVQYGAPLDKYLKKPLMLDNASPYPTFHDVTMSPSKGNAPVSTKYNDVEQILERAARTKETLERNLEHIVRERDNVDIYALLGHMEDSDAAEKLRIQRLVDTQINLLSSQIEGEVKEHLQQQHSKVSPKDPSLDSTSIPAKKTNTVISKKNWKANVQSKINTGLRNKKSDVLKPQGGALKGKEGGLKGKENKPEGTLKKSVNKGKKVLKDYKDEEYMNRVYGKAIHESRRTSSKTPYMHYQTTPKPRLSRPPAVQSDEGISRKSSKTQTGPDRMRERGDGVINPEMQYYFDPGVQRTGPPLPPPLHSAPMAGKLVPMAIQLGAPRHLGSTQPVAITHPRPPPDPNSNVGVVHIQAEVDKKTDGLTIQTLPPVDIDSEPPTCEDSSVQSDHPAQAFNNYITVKDQVDDSPMPRHANTDMNDEDSFDNENFEGEDETPGITLPGYRVPQGQYNGPEFPPRVHPPPPREVCMPSSDILAADLKRRDMLENKAVDWIEQELLARLVTEMYNKQPQRDVVNDTIETVESDDSVAFPSKEIIPEAIGQDGLQLFISAGQPVDDGLVSSLVEEVLNEKIRTLLGERQNERVPVKPIQVEIEQDPVRLVSPEQAVQLETPEVTPKSSPVPTPHRHVSPPITPSLTPDGSVSCQSEIGLGTELMTTMEQTLPGEVSIVAEEEESLLISRHDILTPTITPPPPGPSPPQPPTPTPTPSPTLSPRSPTPRPKTPLKASTPSPIPWGDPDSPLSEANPHHDTIEEEPPTPSEKTEESVAVSEEPIIIEQEEPVSPEPVQPPTPVVMKPDTPEHSPSTSEDSPISDTEGLSISEGQWLVSRSEGQVPDFKDYSRPPAVNVSQTSTLADLDQDLSEISASEGEIIHHTVPDPVLSLLHKMKQPIHFGDGSTSPGEVGPSPEGADLGRQGASPGRQREDLRRKGAGIKRQELNDENVDQDLRGSYEDLAPLPSNVIQVVSSEDRTMKLGDLEEKERTLTGPQPKTENTGKMGATMSDQGTMKQDPYGTRTMSEQGTTKADLYGYGTRTMSDMDTRTMTPDQINIDTLLQAGYLSRTFSDTDYGGTQTMDRTGTMNTMGQSQTMDQSQTLGQSQTIDMGATGGSTLNKMGFNRTNEQTLNTTGHTDLQMSVDSIEAQRIGKMSAQAQEHQDSKPMILSVNIPSVAGTGTDGSETVSDVSEISGGEW